MLSAAIQTIRKMIYTVVTRYELGEMKRIIRQVDNKAFMNITETVEIVGRFNVYKNARNGISLRFYFTLITKSDNSIIMPLNML